MDGQDFSDDISIDLTETKSEKPIKSMNRRKYETRENSVIAMNNAGEIYPDMNELYTKIGDVFSCNKCERKARKSSDIRRHVEVHIDGLSFECPLNCGNTFRSRMQLKNHKNKCKIDSFLDPEML